MNPPSAGDRADLVAGELAGGLVHDAVEVEPPGDVGDGGDTGRRAQHQQIGPAAEQVGVVHPHHTRGDLLRRLRRRRGGEHVAAGDVDLPVQHDGDGLARFRGIPIALQRGEPRDPCAGAGAGVHHGVADPQGAAAQGAGIAAEPGVWPQHDLHRQPRRRVGRRRVDRGLFQRGEQGGPVVPAHAGARRGHVVAVARHHRDGGQVLPAQLVEQRADRRHRRVERPLLEPGEVHLVHRQHELAHAEQCRDRGVPAGLHQHALGGVDQQHRDLGGGGAGRHVARVLLVARRVGQDEAPAGRFEIAIGDVDGDTLLAFGRQPVDQQRVVAIAGHGAEPPAVLVERRHRIVRHRAAFEQEPSDQGGFAVVDAAAGEDAQKLLGHQKYPSRFFSSIEAS